MRGLFLRIYAALAAVLVIGLLLAGTLRSQRHGPPFNRDIATFSSFPSAAASALGRAAPSEQEATLLQLSNRFRHPVRLLPREAVQATLSDSHRVAFSRGEPVTVTELGDTTLHVPLAGQPFVATLGPVARPDGRPPIIIFLLVGTLVVLAVVLSVWLRPLQTELEGLVRVADALGSGRLDARSRLPSDATLGPLSGALDLMADRVQASIRERESLIADREKLLHAVSHELRSPLQRMRFGLELLDGETDGDRVAERLSELQGDIDQLDALVGELLDWARAAAPARNVVAVDLNDLAWRLVGDARRLRPGLRITTRGTADTIQGNPPQLERALGNLVSNAARWANTTVEVRLDAATVEVHDDGPGVPEADRTRIFEPFVRLDAARTHDAGGVGLGLALAARIAEQHHASLTVTDSPLGGACFRWLGRPPPPGPAVE